MLGTLKAFHAVDIPVTDSGGISNFNASNKGSKIADGTRVEVPKPTMPDFHRLSIYTHA